MGKYIGGKGWKERGKRSDGRRRREGSGKRFEGGKKLWVYVLRGPGMFPVTFVRGMDEAETLTFLCPVMSATNENTLLMVLRENSINEQIQRR